ncbi:MAG: hypothetical protein H6718_07690 [Polyangiaceae bacterium]|nr:hypothetical protein [Polyangiaceae bacterium]
MTSASKFLEAVRKGRPGGNDGPESEADYWTRQQEQWVADLRALRESIRGWLEPLTTERAVRLQNIDFSTTEPNLGQYMAPGLAIEILSDPPKRVELRPRGMGIVGFVEPDGTRIVGASGRIDLECEFRRETVLRFREEGGTRWCWFAGGKKVEVDEASFFDLLGRVTNIHSES